MKKPINLSQDPSEQRHHCREKIRGYQLRSLNVQSESLPLYRVKRFNASAVWSFSSNGLSRNQNIIKEISKVLRVNKAIKKLILDLRGISLIKNEDLVSLNKALTRLKSLEKINMRDFFQYDKAYSGLYGFMKSLTTLPFLKTLSLTISDTKVDLYHMSQSLKRIATLKEITFKLFNCPQATSKELQKYFGSFNRLARLEKISQIFYNSYLNMTDESLKELRLNRLVSLKEYVLDLNHCSQLTDKSLYYFKQGLKGLSGLQKIYLEFWKSLNFSDFGLYFLWKMMKSLPQLQETTLIFSECSRITDVGFCDMNGILKHLPLLRKIRLEFYDCPQITSEGIQNICGTVKRFASLQSVCFSFRDCHGITDQGVKQVIDCLNDLKNLCEIKVDFMACPEITEISLNNMLGYLKASHSLEKAVIGFAANNIIDEHYEAFDQEIEILKEQRPNLEVEELDYS